MTPGPVAIAPADGPVGAALARLLEQRRRMLTMVVREWPRPELPDEAEYVVVAGGLGDSELAVAVQHADTTVLVIPRGLPATGTATAAIDATRSAGVQRLILVTSVAASGDPQSELGRAHREIEEYLTGGGPAAVIVRLGILAEDLSQIGSGLSALAPEDQRRTEAAAVAPVDVAHLAEGLLSVIDGGGSTGQTLELTAASATPLADAIARREAALSGAESAPATGEPDPEDMRPTLEAIATGAFATTTTDLEALTGRAAVP